MTRPFEILHVVLVGTLPLYRVGGRQFAATSDCDTELMVSISQMTKEDSGGSLRSWIEGPEM